MQKYLYTTWRLWKLLKPFHKDFYIQVFFIMISQLGAILSVSLSAKFFDNISNKNFQVAFYIVLYILLVRLFMNILSYFSDSHSFKTLETNVQQFLQEYSFQKVFKLTPAQYQEDHSAIKLQVIGRGESAVSEIVGRIVLDILPIVTQIIFSLVAIFLYSKPIALVVFVTLVISVFWSYKFTNYHRKFVKQNMDNWDKFQKIRTESFQHLYLIKIISVSKKFLNSYLNKRKINIDYHVFTWMKNIKNNFWRRNFSIFSKSFSNIILLYQAMRGFVTVGGVYAVWSYSNNVYEQISNITSIMRWIPLRFVELDKYLEIIDKEPDFDENGKYDFVNGDIVFENLFFKYPKGESNVLSNLNLRIKEGQKVAFVGHSGSGKTTITKFLLRAYDYQNKENGDSKLECSIKINGRELNEINADDIRKNIGYVEQHVDLFDDTVRNNILLSVDEKTLSKLEKEKSEKTFINENSEEEIYKNKLEERLDDVARLARIDEFYNRLGEKKFDAEIGERGVKLSGGERQRIGIARAIIRDPSILIFDEATSALDTVNEKYIKEAIDNVSKGRTTIIIAHRLSTIMDADMIVVMDNGKIVATGTHDELLQNSEKYQELVKHQNAEGEN